MEVDLDPFVGQVLQGRYRVRERVGAGGMGTVYRAVQVPFERDVAVKVLAAEHSRKEQLVQRFATEALIIAKLRHPNTLKLYDFGRAADGRLYIVSEFLSGQPLDVVLEQVGALTPIRAMKILGMVCDSLAEAHARAIVHRDLKPANIFLEHIGDQEIVKVLDFGVARVAETHSHTITGTIFGTPAYMSPEQAHGEEVDARSDLYALGVIAYQCLAGSIPFSGTTPMSVLLKHIKDQPVPLLELNPPVSIDPQVDGLVMRLLEKEPDDRPASALVVRKMIDSILRRLTEDPEADHHLDTLSRPRIPRTEGLKLATPPHTPSLMGHREGADDGEDAGRPRRRIARGPLGPSRQEERSSRLLVATVVLAMLAAAGWYAWTGGLADLTQRLTQAAAAADASADASGGAPANPAEPVEPAAGAVGQAAAKPPEFMGPPEADPPATQDPPGRSAR